MTDTDALYDLAEQFDLNTERHDPEDIAPELINVMQYIDEQTGLLGDYHNGIVHLGEGGRIIQWYGRTKFLSAHNNLLNAVQMELDGVLLAAVGTRTHPDTEEPAPYAEIHLAENWGYDDE